MSYISTNIQGGLGNQLFQIANLLIYYNKINEKKEIIFKYEEKLDNFFNLERKTFWNSLFLNQFKLLYLVNTNVQEKFIKVAWPSGLRRWFKAPVSSGAWVRIPPLP